MNVAFIRLINQAYRVIEASPGMTMVQLLAQFNQEGVTPEDMTEALSFLFQNGLVSWQPSPRVGGVGITYYPVRETLPRRPQVVH